MTLDLFAPKKHKPVLHHGDCLAVLKTLDDASVDAVVTDPPYLIDFMGKGWDSADGIAGKPEVWAECLRVLKPGGHLLAFGATRTYHRMTCAIEDAGFEIRDSIHWMYGSGFPKSLNIGDGRGTALKPSHEPVVVARKPLAGTVAANVERYGTGALNIDASRVGSEPRKICNYASVGAQGAISHPGTNRKHAGQQYSERIETSGRWPPNLLLSHKATAWYTLRQDVSTEVRRAVYSYYGVDEALRTLRQQLSRDAFSTSQTALLREGVRWRFSEGHSQEGMDYGRVCAVCSSISSDSCLGKSGTTEVLLQSVWREGQQKVEAPRDQPLAAISSENAGCSDRQVSTRELLPMEGRQMQRERVLECSSGQPSRTPKNTSETDVSQEVSTRASRCSCGNAWTPFDEGRSGASSERRETGQQTAELDRGAEIGTQHRTPRSGEGVDAFARGEPCLEVADRALASFFQEFFGLSFVTEDCTESACDETCAVAELDRQSGTTKSVGKAQFKPQTVYNADAEGYDITGKEIGYGDIGGASRFFPVFRYQAKASRSEREAGLREAGLREAEVRTGMGGKMPVDDNGKVRDRFSKVAANTHPTVKPIALMEWLATLVTPPGGVVLDPFMGSGTTGVAAVRKGFRFVGIEREDEYLAIARARIEAA